MATHRVPFEATSVVLSHIAPLAVSTATYAVERLDRDPADASRTLQSGAATVNTNVLTVDADSGVSQLAARKINVDDTTIEIGEVGLIEATDGSAREHFTVAGKGSGYLIAEYYLAGDYSANAARVVRPTISLTLDNAIAAEAEYVEQAIPLRVTWTYTLAAGKQLVFERVQIVRATASDAGVADVQLALREAFPDLAERMPESADLAGFIRFAQKQVARMLRVRGIQPDQLLAGDAGRDLVFWRTVLHLAENGHVPANRDPEVWLADAQRHYRDVSADVTRGTPGGDALEVDTFDRSVSPKARQVFAQL